MSDQKRDVIHASRFLPIVIVRTDAKLAGVKHLHQSFGS